MSLEPPTGVCRAEDSDEVDARGCDVASWVEVLAADCLLAAGSLKLSVGVCRAEDSDEVDNASGTETGGDTSRRTKSPYLSSQSK